ncbi:hypothetical protein [Spongiivirga citrea]|uniref:Uncharacterized protein n=1 Tax=Spongiivirga citrea TaxID=1481457 RepID=A0A6M0CQR1_9FLAO|nr:hypothetical protein [Spongiivirga citrea]NER18209.1 hypothetical protein [Spongiivirga citrea]
MKYYKYFQFAYLAFAALFIYEGIGVWNSDRTRSYTLLFLAAIAVFVFFFKRRFAKKLQDRNNQR